MLSDFEQELLNVSSQVDEYLDKNQFKDVFCPDEILHSSFHYLELGGKRLRPAVTLFSCGAGGGDPSKALPAAAAVEIWHNFTLAHDDIIDQDELVVDVPSEQLPATSAIASVARTLPLSDTPAPTTSGTGSISARL